MGSELVDDVGHPGWFEFYDDGIEVDPSSEGDRAFLAGLRARALSNEWSCEPYDTWAYHELDDGQHLLRVGVWLDDYENQRTLLTCGVEFDGTRIVGGEAYHDIPFDLEKPFEEAMEFSGPVERLVERAGDWFEWVLKLPIERREWFEDGELAYREWVVASTGRRLMLRMGPRPHRPADRITLVRGVRKTGASGWRRWWDFGNWRGK